MQARGSTPIGALAERCDRSRFAVARWLSGEAQPRLPDFFALVDAMTGRLPDLIAELVPIEAVPALLARHRAASAARRLAFEEPWTEAVLRFMETESYRALPEHEPGWIARAARHRARARTALRGQADRGRHPARGATAASRVSGQLTVDTRADPQALRQLMAHWSEVALSRFGSASETDLFAYNVLSVSHARPDRASASCCAPPTARSARSSPPREPAEAAALHQPAARLAGSSRRRARLTASGCLLAVQLALWATRALHPTARERAGVAPMRCACGYRGSQSACSSACARCSLTGGSAGVRADAVDLTPEGPSSSRWPAISATTSDDQDNSTLHVFAPRIAAQYALDERWSIAGDFGVVLLSQSPDRGPGAASTRAARQSDGVRALRGELGGAALPPRARRRGAARGRRARRRRAAPARRVQLRACDVGAVGRVGVGAEPRRGVRLRQARVLAASRGRRSSSSSRRRC